MHIQLRMPNDPSKAEEIAVWQKFINSLPKNTYLKEILRIAYEFVPIMIKQDFNYPLEDPVSYADQSNEIASLTEALNVRSEALENKLVQLQIADEKIESLKQRIDLLESTVNILNSKAVIYERHKPLFEYLERRK